MAITNCAYGIYVDDGSNVDYTKIKKSDGSCPIHFVIGDGGSNNTVTKKIDQWPQLAYDMNIPFLMRFAVSGNCTGVSYNYGDLAKGFPQPADDPAVKAAAKAKGSKLMHGLLLEFSDYTSIADGGKVNILTEQNFANIIQFYVDAMYKILKLPLWNFFPKYTDLVKTFGDGAGNTLTTVLNSLNGCNCTLKLAFPGQATANISWDDFPYVPDNYIPQYVMNNDVVPFSLYSRTAFILPGITDNAGNPKAVWLFKYSGSPANLYNELNYTPRAVTTPIEPTDPEEPIDPTTPTDPTTPVIGDLATTNSLLSQILAELKRNKTIS